MSCDESTLASLCTIFLRLVSSLAFAAPVSSFFPVIFSHPASFSSSTSLSYFSSARDCQPVAYTLQRDRRSQRITAINLEPVSEAAVSDEFFPGQELLGMVSRKPTLWPRDRDPQLSNCGKIDFKYDGQLFHASFYNEDVVPDTVRDDRSGKGAKGPQLEIHARERDDRVQNSHTPIGYALTFYSFVAGTAGGAGYCCLLPGH